MLLEEFCEKEGGPVKAMEKLQTIRGKVRQMRANVNPSNESDNFVHGTISNASYMTLS